MLFSGISPIIRTGDSFDAQFTVRNASEHAFEANVSARVEGLPNPPQPVQKLQLGPGDGKTIGWKISVPTAVAELKYHVDATTVAGGPSDHLVIAQRVLKAVAGTHLPGDAAALGKADRAAGPAAGRRDPRRGRRRGDAQSVPDCGAQRRAPVDD